MTAIASLQADPLALLRGAAARDPKLAIKQVAKQFEALFMQELMKSMRQATQSTGLLDNEGTQMGTELLDSEYAGQMTGLKGGLSEAIARQLERQMGLTDEGAKAQAPAGPPSELLSQRAPQRMPATAQAFVARHGDDARQAEAASGIPASFMIAQAAHETGWGRKEIRHADGSNSFNLFGIKAGAGWKGATAQITTTEFVDGQPRKLVQTFRAYASFAESFADYARLMKTSPRYRDVVAQAQSAQGFAQGLQNAGYATDPAYADKLGRIINTTLRLQRSIA